MVLVLVAGEFCGHRGSQGQVRGDVQQVQGAAGQGSAGRGRAAGQAQQRAAEMGCHPGKWQAVRDLFHKTLYMCFISFLVDEKGKQKSIFYT